MVRTAVLVSGGGTNLQTLIDSKLFGDLKNCELTAVISSNPQAYALVRAEAAGIPCFTVDRSIFPNDASYNEAVLRKLRDMDIELVVLAGYTQPIYRTLPKAFPNRIIAVHPSLLPAFPDADPDGEKLCEQVLRRGAKITGATAYFVTEEPCQGPIILQKAVEVLDDDTVQSLQARITQNAEWLVLPQAIGLYCDGKLRFEGGIVKQKRD
ncbi:MAG: phosphoribosylglycinamide formyltransferase [Oscillospiraceae bacterium]|nr:phosphoribosylglycinamide formyltransferase [Oscillospiraceae bacterium]